MIFLKIFCVAFLLLLSGDFVSTFCYHVPEHIFGKFHAVVHHSPNRSFIRYAISSKKPVALITGFFGAFPYLMFIPLFWIISPIGTVLGLILAECHVEWRHVSLQKWKTPNRIKSICRILCITTPERHWEHHLNSRVAYGDIFTFYDKPAQAWFRVLLRWKKKFREKYS
ncbi:MAG: sterol desaturase family protein [Lyngbya sp.]|nr:sterol desaturase family protein [Lyngbya sp.]